MAIVVDGPNNIEEAWDFLSLARLAEMLATDDAGSTGASIQKSGSFGETVAMHDQIAGKVGPMIGKWDPEKASRMIQEF